MIVLLNLGRLLMVVWIVYGLVLIFAPALLHRSPDQVGGAVAGAGVHGDDPLHGPLLAEQRLEHGRQPALAVVADQNGGHHMAAQRFVRICGVRAGARRRCEL